MAALIKHVLSKSNQNILGNQLPAVNFVQQRYYRAQNAAKRNKVKPKKLEKVPVPETRKLKSVADSISTRGFLRCQDDYTPPEDAEEQLATMFTAVVGSEPTDLRTIIPTKHKFALFESCFATFNHSIPNSILHNVNTFGDLREFYLTPVNTTLPLDKMKTSDLPPNLHVQYEPIRFHPDEDTKFNGQTAFPKSNTLVTGLRAKRKYKGHQQTDFWKIDY
ncbi:hypothetical protein GE061_018471 [Apolygus lucorum]|uniref:Large ribosomal subunit protein mL50 n=1 Tax=Apolygus lucorum TaxID=248454 RepID=A0A8S9XDU3_APOLU|nr:hypothetical protein GE061_018471 [Apolygus lucorum]